MNCRIPKDVQRSSGRRELVKGYLAQLAWILDLGAAVVAMTKLAKHPVDTNGALI